MLKVNCPVRQERTKVAKVLQKQYLGRPEAKGYLLQLFRIRADLYSSVAFLHHHLAASGTKGEEQDYSQQHSQAGPGRRG